MFRVANNYRKCLLSIVLLLLIFLYIHRKSQTYYEIKIITQDYVAMLNSTAIANITTTSDSRTSSGINASSISFMPRKSKKLPSNNEQFYVFSKKCKIPRPNPFAQEIMDIFPRLKLKTCTDEPDLINVSYNRSRRQYILHVNDEVLLQLRPNISHFACHYREILRGANDTHSRMRRPVYFLQDTPVPRHMLGAVVQCHELHNAPNVIQTDAFAFVQFPARKEAKPEKALEKYPSVILLGIDSMSRMNFQRTMPLTARFVRQRGWFEMQGYNKVADNTLPNLLAILTGRTPDELKGICDVERPGCFDHLIYLWNHFKNAGYLTAFAEDVSKIDTFNYQKKGFVRQPVDFYLRPFLMTIELAMDTYQHFGYEYCVGRRLSFSYVYDFCQQFVQRFVDEEPRPVFGIFWTNSFTHDTYAGAMTLDELFIGYLRRFEQHRLFERAIVILLSDHGNRYGPLVELKDGFLEERLPMLHIYVPSWYRAQHPQVERALAMNHNRLSSTYDLHLGLKHVLQRLRPRLHLNLSTGCSACRSLFKLLPRERSCEDAGISEHWCTCQPYMNVPIAGFIKHLANLVLYRINKFLHKKQYDKICHRLYLAHMDMAERKLYFDEEGHAVPAPDGQDTYRLKFSASYKTDVGLSYSDDSAKFRATIKCNKLYLDVVEIPLQFINRLNWYKNTSYCVQDRQVEKFCFCIQSQETLDLVKNTTQKAIDFNTE